MSEINSSHDDSQNIENNTPTWLTEDVFVNILEENVENFKQIKNFKIKPAVATGENFMTLLLNVNIEVELTDGSIKEVSYMAKVMPNTERMQEMLKDWKVFDKEVTSYSSYIPEFEAMYKAAGLDVKFGARIFTTKHTGAPKELVIMEDLRAKGFQNVKRQEGLDMEHTHKALEKLAQFHAASALRYELKGPYPDMYKKCLCSEQDMFADYRENTAKLIKGFLPLYDAQHLAEKLSSYAAVAPDQFQTASDIDADEFNVLNHGDCWSNNIMFKYKSTDGAIDDTHFVDFQMSRYGSPAHDLSYLIISSTKLEHKIKKFDYYVAYYHKHLVQYLSLLKYPKKLPTLKDLQIALFKHGDWAYTVITTVMPILLLDPTEKANMDSVIDEGQKGDELKKLMFTSQRYADHMKQILPWMDNRGLFVYQK